MGRASLGCNSVSQTERAGFDSREVHTSPLRCCLVQRIWTPLSEGGRDRSTRSRGTSAPIGGTGLAATNRDESVRFVLGVPSRGVAKWEGSGLINRQAHGSNPAATKCRTVHLKVMPLSHGGGAGFDSLVRYIRPR